MGARYKLALSMIVSKKELFSDEDKSLHFPCGADRLPSPVTSTVAECVDDPY